MRAFYHSINQVDSIFAKQSLELPRNSNGHNFLGASDKAIKFLSCLILLRAFRNWPNKLHGISGSKVIASPLFYESGLSYTFNFFQTVRGLVEKIESLVPACASPSEVYPADQFH